MSVSLPPSREIGGGVSCSSGLQRNKGSVSTRLLYVEPVPKLPIQPTKGIFCKWRNAGSYSPETTASVTVLVTSLRAEKLGTRAGGEERTKCPGRLRRPTRGSVSMLQRLTAKHRSICLEQAARCRADAEAAANPTVKQDFLQMAERWESLARSYEFDRRVFKRVMYGHVEDVKSELPVDSH
jgi:hypothetical protein